MQQEDKILKTRAASERRWLRVLLQAGVSVIVLAAIYSTLDQERFFSLFKGLDGKYLLFAFSALMINNIITSLRMRYYLSTIRVHLAAWFAIKLGWFVSMLNHVLPGGISGEGYTIWYGKRHHGAAIPDMLRRLLSSRANGLLWMLLFALMLLPFGSALADVQLVVPLVVMAAILVSLSYSVTAKWLLKEPLAQQWHACFYSCLSQLCTFAMTWWLVMAFGVLEAAFIIDYIIVFIIACIVALLPISFGGAGVREMTFVLLAPFFAIDVEIGVALSLTFFFLNFFASLLGIIFLFTEKKPTM